MTNHQSKQIIFVCSLNVSFNSMSNILMRLRTKDVCIGRLGRYVQCLLYLIFECLYASFFGSISIEFSPSTNMSKKPSSLELQST